MFSRLKIALLSMGYTPYFEFGGSETYIRLLSAELIKNDVEVTIIAGWPRNNVCFEDRGKLKIIRVPVMNFPIRPLWYQLQNIFAIKNLVRKMDVVHANNLTSSIFNKSVAGKTPLLITIHGSMEALSVYLSAFPNKGISPGDLFYLMEYPILKRLYTRDLLDSTSLSFISAHGYKEAVKSLGYSNRQLSDKSSIIYPGIDLDELKRADVKVVDSEGSLDVEFAFVGRLFYPKGITYTLEAFNIIVNEMGKKRAKLHILGDGPLKGWVTRYVKKHRLTDNVIIHGYVNRNIVLRTLCQTKAMILPSLYEGCPFVLMEANCLGVPVVAFDFAWSKEFIQNGVNGYTSSPFNVYGLAENLLKATGLDSEPIKMGAKKFDIRITAKKTIQTYQRLLS